MVHHKRMTNRPQHYAHIHMLAQQHVPLHTTHLEMVTRSTYLHSLDSGSSGTSDGLKFPTYDQTSSDIFAFGVLIIEVISHQQPIPHNTLTSEPLYCTLNINVDRSTLINFLPKRKSISSQQSSNVSLQITENAHKHLTWFIEFNKLKVL